MTQRPSRRPSPYSAFTGVMVEGRRWRGSKASARWRRIQTNPEAEPAAAAGAASGAKPSLLCTRLDKVELVGRLVALLTARLTAGLTAGSTLFIMGLSSSSEDGTAQMSVAAARRRLQHCLVSVRTRCEKKTRLKGEHTQTGRPDQQLEAQCVAQL